MKYFIFFIMGLFLNPIKNCNAQFLNNLELNTSISKEMYGINQFSNTFKVGFDYKIDDKKHVGLETGIIRGLNDFLLRVRYLSDPFKIHKVYPLYVNYSFFKNRNQFSIALGTELFEFGPNNVLEYSYWWTSGNNVIIPGEANDFKIRDRMQLIVPFTYGYQFYKNLSNKNKT